jgi:hypothetical protein
VRSPPALELTFRHLQLLSTFTRTPPDLLDGRFRALRRPRCSSSRQPRLRLLQGIYLGSTRLFGRRDLPHSLPVLPHARLVRVHGQSGEQGVAQDWICDSDGSGAAPRCVSLTIAPSLSSGDRSAKSQASKTRTKAPALERRGIPSAPRFVDEPSGLASSSTAPSRMERNDHAPSSRPCRQLYACQAPMQTFSPVILRKERGLIRIRPSGVCLRRPSRREKDRKLISMVW